MKKLILLFLFLTFNAFAQDDQFEKQIQEILKAREEMLKSLMDDSDFSSGEMEKRMMEMMKRFSQGGGFDIQELDSPVVGEYDWVATDTHKILKLKVKQTKDNPLDIKIEKGQIKIKGNVEATQGSGKNKKVRKTSFEKSFSLPDDVDQTNPEFENKDGEVLIKFKKLSKTKATPAPKKQPDRVPVAPDSSDLSI